jgi:hypothetical protein
VDRNAGRNPPLHCPPGSCPTRSHLHRHFLVQQRMHGRIACSPQLPNLLLPLPASATGQSSSARSAPVATATPSVQASSPGARSRCTHSLSTPAPAAVRTGSRKMISDTPPTLSLPRPRSWFLRGGRFLDSGCSGCASFRISTFRFSRVRLTRFVQQLSPLFLAATPILVAQCFRYCSRECMSTLLDSLRLDRARCSQRVRLTCQ